MFGGRHLYMELQRHCRRGEDSDNQSLVELASAFRIPVVATGGVRFAAPDRRPLFDVLTCIHHHTDLMQAGRRLAPNAERYLKAPAEMAACFRDVPGAVARGELNVRIGLEYELAHAPQAHEDLAARRTTGKLILVP